jgi:hypothetical protein
VPGANGKGASAPASSRGVGRARRRERVARDRQLGVIAAVAGQTRPSAHARGCDRSEPGASRDRRAGVGSRASGRVSCLEVEDMVTMTRTGRYRIVSSWLCSERLRPSHQVRVIAGLAPVGPRAACATRRVRPSYERGPSVRGRKNDGQTGNSRICSVRGPCHAHTPSTNKRLLAVGSSARGGTR